MAPQLVSWGKAKTVSASVVRRIQEGTGPVDAARDVIANAEVVRASPAIKAKLLCTLGELVIEAVALQGVLRQQRVLWQHGAMIFGPAVFDFVPTLGARGRRNSKREQGPVAPENRRLRSALRVGRGE